MDLIHFDDTNENTQVTETADDFVNTQLFKPKIENTTEIEIKRKNVPILIHNEN